MELRLSSYLVLLSIDSKTRSQFRDLTQMDFYMKIVTWATFVRQLHSPIRLLHGPSLVSVGLSVGNETSHPSCAASDPFY